MTDSYRKQVLHRMGYYNDQEGILRRYRNEGTSWNSHLEHSRNMVLKAISMFDPENIVVLGSGWLLDLPLQEMTMKKRSVRLVDIILPQPVEDLVRKYRNVEFEQADVTGGLVKNVYENTSRGLFKTKTDQDRILDYTPYLPPENSDLVVSLNILNQLDSLPVEYLRRKTKISFDEETKLRQHVQKQHIDMLCKFNSLLITDFCEHPLGNDDKSQTRPTVATALPEGIFREEWDWIFDTRKSYNTRSTTVFRVAGIIISR